MLVKTASMAVFYFEFRKINLKKLLFLGGDKRQKIAADFLRKQSFICDEFIDTPPRAIDLSNYCATILPIPTTRDGVHLNSPLINEKIPLEKITKNISENQLLITYNFKPTHNFVVDLSEDNDFAFLNAIPTAEGAVKILIEATDFTLWQSKILIIGNGKIGKILSQRLSSFGALITVSARKSIDFSYIEAFGFKSLNTSDLLGHLEDFDVIINTVPYPIIGKEHVDECKDNCLFLELSSAPFGIDKQAVILGEKEYIYAPALPGKIAPKTAGEILGKTIKKIIGENLSESHQKVI